MSLENASKRLSAHYIITSRNVAVHVTEIKADMIYLMAVFVKVEISAYRQGRQQVTRPCHRTVTISLVFVTAVCSNPVAQYIFQNRVDMCPKKTIQHVHEDCLQ